MRRFSLLIAAAAIVGFAGTASANHEVGHEQGKAYGHGCSSAGATAATPGQWFQALKEHPQLAGQNPAEIADTENTTPGWEGFEQTPHVGALIAQFCGEPS